MVHPSGGGIGPLAGAAAASDITGMLAWGRVISAAAGACLVAGSAALRFAVFDAGVQSARDPRYTVIPQRERVARRAAEVAGE
ncbi:MAG: hypothetical protein ACYCO9_18385 [Streptosporangiaceae bacterium]